MLVKEIKAKGSPQLNLVMLRHNAHNNDLIMRLYFDDWTLIQSMQGFGRKRHAELKKILNAMKIKEVRKWK